MSAPTPAAIPKLDHYKLETEFYDGSVVNPTYEWEFSTRRLKESLKWKRERHLGTRAFGSVWAVKSLDREGLPRRGFSQDLLALITLADSSSAPIDEYAITRLTEGV